MADSSMGASAPLSTVNPHPADTAVRSILAKPVPETARMAFLPRVFGSRLMLQGEVAIFDWMGTLCPSYHGGLWEFIDLSNGGFYMRWDTSAEKVDVVVDGNGYRGQLSPDAASVVATLFALSHLQMGLQLLPADTDRLSDAFYALREFAIEHAEAREILGAID